MKHLSLLHRKLHLLCAVILLTGFTACSTSEDKVEEPKTPQTPEQPENPKPDVPVNNSDWQTVPATGGTIQKDDISITFPDGTFTTDAQVAITEVKKGEIGGEYEASPFYQITLPCNAGKPMTIKIKSEEKNDDISFVAYANAYCMSSGKEKKAELKYETIYSNGEYSATIPAINGDVEGEDVIFTIGLGHFNGKNSGGARTRGWFNQVLHEGKVKNINYQLRYPWSLFDHKMDTLYLVESISSRINEYIKEALTNITDLGFTVDGDKTLYVDFDKKEEDWGGHEVCGVPGGSGWSMWVSLGVKKLLDVNTTEDQIRCTIIHEIFHWFQAYYDPRSNYKKSKKQYGGDEVIMYEMGAVWIEHMMNDGRLNAEWLNTNILGECAKNDRFGLTDVQSRMKGNYQNQGYSMAPLLYYLCTSKEMSVFGFDNYSVLELHEQWRDKMTIRTTLEIMESWAMYTHGCGFFMSNAIDDYYLRLLTGLIDKGINASLLLTGGKMLTEKDNKLPFDGNIYPYGCVFRRVNLIGLKDVPMSSKQLVVKQEKEGVQTYLLVTDKSSSFTKYKEVGEIANVNDSIVIDGKTLESLRQDDGTFKSSFFVVTTRTENFYKDTGTKPWKVTVELQDVPYEVSMISLLGHFSTVDQNGNVELHDNLGGSVKADEGTITTTLKGKNLHIEGSAVTHPMSYMTFDTHISVDINDVTLLDKNKATITKLDMVTNTQSDYGSGDYSSSSTSTSKLTAANVPMTSDYAGMKYWKGSGITGYSWNSTTNYSNKTEYSSMELVDNPANYLEVWIMFKNGNKARAVFKDDNVNTVPR